MLFATGGFILGVAVGVALAAIWSDWRARVFRSELINAMHNCNREQIDLDQIIIVDREQLDNLKSTKVTLH